MSRGPGVWQRQILRVTSGTVVAAVAGIVKTTVAVPDRDDFTAARRGAKGLALAQRVCAVYAWTCIRCGQIQDSDDPLPCCGPVRAMLAVCQPERRRLLLHPAPPPGGVAPAWINDARRPAPGLPVPTVDDLAQLASRRLWEALSAGTAAVSVRDVAALLRLAHEAGREQPAAGHPDERWQAAVRELLWLARSHLRDGWPAFAADVRASAGLAAMWGPPPYKPAGDGKRR